MATLTLKRFSQDVDLANPKQVLYFLVLQNETGKEIRVPSSKEAVETLMAHLYGSSEKTSEVEEPVKEAQSEEEEIPPEEEHPTEDHDPDATFYGDDDNGMEDQSPGYSSEEDVPSL
jgi:hypothetical protein